MVRDVVTEDGAPVEITDDWYAQDAAGNIWYLGEDTAEYEDGSWSTRSGSFEAGVDGAQAGIVMPADPLPGSPTARSTTRARPRTRPRCSSVEEQVEVPAGHYREALMTKDLVPLEPKVTEYKFYALGVGPVLTLKTVGRRAGARSW